jgi:ribosomal protein S4
LKNKQEIKAFYGGISELAYQRLNKKINKLALVQSKPSPNQILSLFETRLDVVVFKLN